jgi:NAD(P)-dependent dehydrogenase (short-subunit alcohol dehydrogenase family)
MNDVDNSGGTVDLDLAGKVAVVTGGSKGIGLAVTRSLLDECARVVVASRTLSAELQALTGDLKHVPVDLTEPQAPARLIDEAVRHFGGVDILVNNAGGPPPGVVLPRFGFLSLSDQEWQSVVDFNLFSAVRACRAAIPVMVERGGGAIVNISSGHGRQPSAVNVHYGAAKAAMINLTKALSEEFGPQGVRVNGVCPGPVITPWWTEEGGAADVLADRMGATRDEVLTNLAPKMMQLATGRLVTPQEVADVVLLLASSRSASTIGAEVVVDGGWLKGC